MSKKQEVLADESAFQQACQRFVGNNVIYCVSSLFYELTRNYDAFCQLFPDYADECLGWGSISDWQGALEDHIRNDADFDDLEIIADHVYYWDDALVEAGYDANLISDKLEELNAKLETIDPTSDEADAITDEIFELETSSVEWFFTKMVGDKSKLHEVLIDHCTDPQEVRELCDIFRLDPCEYEVYEHWLVDTYFAKQLREAGELVFEFENLTVWGRTTTGQSISMDGVIRKMVRELSEEHYVWG